MSKKIIIEDEEEETKPGLAGLIALPLLVVFQVVTPVFLTLFMYGKLGFGYYFQKLKKIESYKHFRKIYLIFAYIWMAVFGTIAIVFAILHIYIVAYIAFVLFYVGNILFVVFAFVAASKFKKAYNITNY